MKPHNPSFARLPFVLAAAIAALLSSANAATLTWDADGATAGQADGAGDWLSAGQWWDGANNVDWTSGDDAIFGNTGAGDAVTLGSPTTVNSLTFNPFTGTYTLGTAAQAITLNTGITKNANSGAVSIISPLTLAAAQSWTNNSSTDLSIADAVDNGGFLLTLAGTGATTLSSDVTGAGGLTKSGSATATLAGTNSSYTGVTTLSGGTLRIATVADAGNNSSIGAYGLTDAAGLLLSGNSNLTYTGATGSSNRGFTLGGSSTITVETDASKLTWGDFTMTGGYTLTAAGGAGSSLDLGTFNFTTAVNQNIAANIPVTLSAVNSTVNQGLTNTGSGLLTIGNYTRAGGGTFFGGGQSLITGTVNIGGTFTNNQTGTITYTGTSFTATALRLFDGNTFVVGGSGTLGTAGTFASGLVFRAASTFRYDSSANQTISGNITFLTTNGGKVTMSGTGTLTLTGSGSTYNGATTVNAGTLLVNNASGSGTGASPVTVNAGTLGGTGSISGSVVVGDGTGSADAILSPGSNGIESIATGNLSFGTDGRLSVEVDGTLATSDACNVTGTVTLDAASTLVANVTGTLAGNQKYFIVTNDDVDPVSGTFSGLAQGSVVGNYGGTDLMISYTGNSGSNALTGGNDIVLYTTGSPYDTWSGGPAADIDTNNDGVLNGVAWVIGAANPNEIVTDKVPTLDNISDPDFFIFNYRRSDTAFADGNTAIQVEYGSDLTGWTPATAGPDIIINPLDDDFGPGIDRVEVKIRRTLAVGNKLFARLNVVVTP